jgi:putative MFS transporter
VGDHCSAIGLLPAGLSLLIRAWVPASPHWLIRIGRLEEARHSLAWALMIDPRAIELPAAAVAALIAISPVLASEFGILLRIAH